MRVASTPEEVERTFERRVRRASVVDVKREGALKGSWVALSGDPDAIIIKLGWVKVDLGLCCILMGMKVR